MDQSFKAIKSFNQPVTQLLNQSMKQPRRQSTNPTIHQLINQSMWNIRKTRRNAMNATWYSEMWGFTKQAQQEQGHNKQTFGTSATDEFKECNTRVSANKIWTICKRLAAWNAQTKVYNTQVSMSEGKLQLWKIMFSGDGQRKVN